MSGRDKSLRPEPASQHQHGPGRAGPGGPRRTGSETHSEPRGSRGWPGGGSAAKGPPPPLPLCVRVQEGGGGGSLGTVSRYRAGG